jgi:enoyl-CoA hydratase/carnithine racemase
MAAQLIVAREGPALVLTLSNPGLRNALAPEMYEAFLPALERAGTDDDIRAVILTGADEFFCAGGNLKRLAANRALPKQVQRDSIDQLHALCRALAACPKPVIAAIEGAAAGAGMSIALGCDLIVAGRGSQFVMSYVKVGLSPDGGGSWYATRALPRQSAMQMLLLGDRFSAQRLFELGVINALTEDGQALERARGLVEEIAQLSPHAVGRIKRLVTSAASSTLDEHFTAERESFVECLHHPDAGEAIDAFLNKRPARF